MRFFSRFRKLFAKKVTDGRPDGYGTETEFVAEVVRITTILPHGNADKLELAAFEMASGPAAYQCVVQRGAFKPGDLAGYFSVDCIAPTSRPEFAFLSTSKSHHRIRAARLRGVFSQGLLVPLAGPRTLGTFLGAEFGVTYYQPPMKYEPQGPNKNRVVRAQPMPIYGVESLKKLPNLFAPDELVSITEKIHGTNFRFGWVRRRILGIPVGWRFVVGSHRVIKEQGRGGHWYGEDVWTQAADKMGLKGRTKSLPGYLFYGELYGYTYSGQAIQDMTYGRSPADGPGLALFDVRNRQGWMSCNDRCQLLCDLGLPQVPIIAMARLGADIPNSVEGKTLLEGKGIREGIVVENLEGPRRKAKFVSQAYLMRKDG